MQLGQIRFEKTVIAAIVEGGKVRPIPGHRLIDLIRRAEAEGVTLAKLAGGLASRLAEDARLLLPIDPPEVWACGCTYEMSASFRDAEHGTREGMYAYVYREPRPEIFFKGTARVCVGPGQPVGIRPDSRFTAPEPELAVVLGRDGAILGYTLCNDVSAWDIERENPLYLPQSKMYDACCALGPVIVTADEISDPYNLQMTCTITRGDSLLFSGEVSTSKLHRKLEELVEYLRRGNRFPSGTVLSTGTGIIVTEEAALAEGDVVSITIPEIGTLSNPAAIV
ncbi:MAG: fumarylacetoacetate hydrolase family protein [Bryobacterales bacterium]|jgi:2-dehydro-3-deoxy-D-arabinonate dehydratase|nr:fumarylacetoacetate hydrolase family protein [Bryobacterales bacterium]